MPDKVRKFYDKLMDKISKIAENWIFLSGYFIFNYQQSIINYLRRRKKTNFNLINKLFDFTELDW